MIAIVPAAGRGTRLGALTATTPKALVPVAGRPVLAWVLRGLALAGASEIIVVVGHLGEQIEACVADLSPVPVAVVHQRAARGTADALLAAAERVGCAPFMYGWGDTIADPAAYERVLRRWDGHAVLGVNRIDDPSSGAAVEVDASGMVRSIVEKPPPGTSSTPFNHAGIGVLPAVAWGHLRAVRPSPRNELEVTSALASLIEAGEPMAAVDVDPVFDIGTPSGLRSADAWARTFLGTSG